MDKIPQFEPWFGQEEKQYLCQCIDDNWITGGKMVREFERRIADLCHVKHAIACSNGTMALYMALKACGIGHGHKVIVPDFTFIASANAVILTGAKPVFFDIDKDTLNIDAHKLANEIEADVNAIMPVHIYGRPADMYAIMSTAHKYGMKVIEDAAQGIGVKLDGLPVGGLGNAGCLSFYADKTMTTGEGGMVLTNDDYVAEKCLYLKHQGRLMRGVYIHEQIGYNFRMTDLQAAVGLAQLERLPEIIANKKRVESTYRKELADLEGIGFIANGGGDTTVPFRIVIMVDNPAGLAVYLDEKGIGTGRVFYPLHRQPCYKSLPQYKVDTQFPNTLWAYEHGLALPSSAKLTDEQIRYICDQIRVFERHSYMHTKLSY